MGKKLVGVGLDFSANGEYAMDWALQNLTREGDEVIVIHVKGDGVDEGEGFLWKDSGAPCIPLREMEEAVITGKYGIQWKAALVEELNSAAQQKGLDICVKVYWGDPKQKLCSAVTDLGLNLLVVGSRGLGAFKKVFLGSVSDYVVSNAVCPITVVKSPSLRERERTWEKDGLCK
ncbi:hypothetical protein SUGI_0876940 [Cryptomeria japonica]|nr:hypothetical protein SUGI_0876940 [Cryptomeria japonica]